MTREAHLAHALARLLRGGTIVASLLIAIGWLVASLTGDTRLIVAGIGVFILLPLARVTAMAIAFIRHRDRRYGVCAIGVLTIIASGIGLGVMNLV